MSTDSTDADLLIDHVNSTEAGKGLGVGTGKKLKSDSGSNLAALLSWL